MERRRIPTTILAEILPEHRISGHRFERNAILPRLIAVHERAPAPVARRIQDREVRAAARDVARGHVHEE